MNAWLTPMCQWGAADDGTAFGITCAVLAAVLLVIIALGFGPLRTWLGADAGRGRLGRRSTSEASDLLATWRLYRQLGRDDRFLCVMYYQSWYLIQWQNMHGMHRLYQAQPPLPSKDYRWSGE
jgi:hypothetical protein